MIAGHAAMNAQRNELLEKERSSQLAQAGLSGYVGQYGSIGLLESTEGWIAHLSDQMKAATALRDLLKSQPEIEEIINKAQFLLR